MIVDFNGFSAEGIQFLTDLAHNNDRDWFNPRKDVFKREVQAPALAFVEALGARLKSISPVITFDTRANGSGSMMRIYRDVRFSKDKRPYKTNIGIVFWEGSGKKTEVPSFYFHLQPGNAWMAGGLYRFPRPSLERYRQAVDDDEAGPDLLKGVAAVQDAGLRVEGEQYVRVPRGFAKDHPRADWLRYKGLTAISPPIDDEVVCSAELVDLCFEYCLDIAPLHRWLVQHVG